MKYVIFAFVFLAAACGNITPSGDMNSVNTPAAGGLTGGSNTGSANLSIRTDCGTGSGVAWDGNSWECSALGSSYTAGDGLLLTGSDFDVVTGTGIAISSDAVTLNMTAQDCSAGQYLDSVTATGVFACVAEVGDISNVSAGTGLTGGGASGSVTLTLNMAGASCGTGAFMSSLSATGTGSCSNVAQVAGQTTVSTTGTIDDYALPANATSLLFTGASPITLNSMQGVVAGRFLSIINTGGSTLTIPHNTGTTAGLRFATPTGASVVVPDNYMVFAVYETTDNRWHVTLPSSSSSGFDTAGAGLTSTGTTVDVVGTTNSITVNANSIEIASRDFGDGTFSSNGTVFSLDNSVVTSAKLNITTTSCSAGSFVSSISAGGVGTCTADTDAADVVQTLTGVSGTVNALGVNSTTTLLYLRMTGNTTICGIANGAAGRRFKMVLDDSGFVLTLQHNCGTATATDRFFKGDGLDWQYRAADMIDFAYDTGMSVGARWTFGPATIRMPTLTTAAAITAGTSLNATTYVQTGTDGVYAGTNSDVYLAPQNDSVNFMYGTNATATGYINAAGYQNGTTQTRSLGIMDGTGTATGDTIMFFDGTDRSVRAYGDLQVDVNLEVHGNTILGNADTDETFLHGEVGFTGADVTVSSGNCTVAGEAQIFDITSSGGDMTSCVVNYNRTFTAPRCTFSPKTSGAAASIASPGLYYTTTTTQFTLQHVSGNTPVSNTWTVNCFDDKD